jgi:hypothetical protein
MLESPYSNLNTQITSQIKTYRAEQKAAAVEESKKGYTGDALALRGEERRDKLR